MKLLQGDCLELMQDIPDGSIDMVLCDLPYGTTTKNKWDAVIPFDDLWFAYKRIIKDNGAIHCLDNLRFHLCLYHRIYICSDMNGYGRSRLLKVF